MNWVTETLAEYGRQLGIEGFSLGQHGVAQLQLESGALIAIEPVRRGEAEEVLVYVIHPLRFDAATLRRRALEKVHYANGGLYPVQVATRGEGSDTSLLLVVRLPEREFTLPVLGRAVDFLERWFNELQSGR